MNVIIFSKDLPILGIDIDGVLNNLYKPLSILIKKEFGKKVDITNYDMFSNIDITESEKREFCNKHEKYLNTHVEAEWRCQFFLNKISQFYSLYLITARHYDIASNTIMWLNKNNIPFDEILFNCGDKVDCCQFLKTKYMIDDSPWNIRKLNKNQISCLIYDRPYNKQVKETKFIQRVENWQDIYNIVLK